MEIFSINSLRIGKERKTIKEKERKTIKEKERKTVKEKERKKERMLRFHTRIVNGIWYRKKQMKHEKSESSLH